MTKQRAHILDELQRFHQGKLDEIRVKRGCSALDGARQIVIGGAVNLIIDPRQKKLVLSWDKWAQSLQPYALAVWIRRSSYISKTVHKCSTCRVRKPAFLKLDP